MLPESARIRGPRLRKDMFKATAAGEVSFPDPNTGRESERDGSAAVHAADTAELVAAVPAFA